MQEKNDNISQSKMATLSAELSKGSDDGNIKYRFNYLWFGGKFPEDRKNILTEWKKNNTDLEIKIWYHSDLFTHSDAIFANSVIGDLNNFINTLNTIPGIKSKIYDAKIIEDEIGKKQFVSEMELPEVVKELAKHARYHAKGPYPAPVISRFREPIYLIT